jgi:hypothetical protein
MATFTNMAYLPSMSKLDHTGTKRCRVTEPVLRAQRSYAISVSCVKPVERARNRCRTSAARVDCPDVVGAYSGVGGHQGQALRACLSDEEPVEGIAVVQRKSGDAEPMVRGQSKDSDPGFKNVAPEIVGDAELADRRLHADLGE